MIRFFRTIRQNLLAQGRFTRYLTYAIGEILLVVIGILIALQINTWNEKRNNKKQENLLVKDLQTEFQINRAKLDSTIQYQRAILAAANQLLSLIGEPEEIILQHNTDSLIYLSLDYIDFHPSQSVVSELISSGKLNLISSDELRSLIFDWQSAMNEAVESYETMDEMCQTMTLPYMAKNGSMKNIDQYGLMKMNGPSKFGPQNHRLLQKLEFENHMDNQAWGVSNYLIRLERLESIIDEIRLQTESILHPLHGPSSE